MDDQSTVKYHQFPVVFAGDIQLIQLISGRVFAPDGNSVCAKIGVLYYPPLACRLGVLFSVARVDKSFCPASGAKKEDANPCLPP